MPGLVKWSDMNNPWPFKLLYDGDCPFCVREIEWLQRRDRHERLIFENIASPDFRPQSYGLKLEEVTAAIHGVHPDGRVVTGMEVLRQAYSAAGMGWLMAPTKWPGLKWVFDALYRLFARNRIGLGRMFGRSCPTNVCARSKTP